MNDKLKFLTLHKYWLQADLMKRNFYYEVDNLSGISTKHDHSSRIVTYMDFWMANLDTVVSGYKKENLNYAHIEDLIQSNKLCIDELKKYRNSTFHFETPRRRNDKMKTFRKINMFWIDEIHNYIGKYLYDELTNTNIITIPKQFFIINNFEKINNHKRILSKPPLNDEELSHYWFCQYWLRTRLMRAHFERSLHDSKNSKIEQIIYLGYWYIMLVCVIEGYQELKLKNPNLDILIRTGGHVEKLKKYRHSFTGYHQDYYNQHLIHDFVSDPNTVSWVTKLHDSFHEFIKAEIKFKLDNMGC